MLYIKINNNNNNNLIQIKRSMDLNIKICDPI